MGQYGFAFNDPDFSDRVLRVEIADDSLDSRSDYNESEGARNRKRKRDNLERENGDETAESSDLDESSVAVEVKTYHISSPILAAKSPFFYKLFKNGMRESQEKNATLRISSSEEAALMDLMKFMYTDILSATTTYELLSVLMAADKFEVTSCMSHCTQLLLEMISLDSALLYLELPSSSQQLIDASKQYLTVYFRDFTKFQEEAMILPLCALEVVLGSVGLQVDSEDQVFDFIFEWSCIHYPELEERREVITKRLARFIWFPYVSSSRLKRVVKYPEFHSEKVLRIVVGALIDKAEVPYGELIRASKDVTTPNYGCLERVYKYRIIKVVQLESPQPHCFVFFDIKKGDCANLIQSSGIYSKAFRLGERWFFLNAKCRKSRLTSLYHFGLYLQMGQNSATCSVDCEFAVTRILSEDFEMKFKAFDCPVSQDKVVGNPNLLRISWDAVMADNSEYFVNGILHLRAELIIIKSQP